MLSAGMFGVSGALVMSSVAATSGSSGAMLSDWHGCVEGRPRGVAHWTLRLARREWQLATGGLLMLHAGYDSKSSSGSVSLLSFHLLGPCCHVFPPLSHKILYCTSFGDKNRQNWTILSYLAMYWLLIIILVVVLSIFGLFLVLSFPIISFLSSVFLSVLSCGFGFESHSLCKKSSSLDNFKLSYLTLILPNFNFVNFKTSTLLVTLTPTLTVKASTSTSSTSTNM